MEITILVGSVNNLCRSEQWPVILKKCFFALHVVSCTACTKKIFNGIYSRLCKCQRDQKTPEQIPSGILKKPDAYRVQMLPQHVHGLSQAGSGLGPEESTSSMASGMIGKYGNISCEV